MADSFYVKDIFTTYYELVARVEQLESLLRECREILVAPQDVSYEEMHRLGDRIEAGLDASE